MTVPATPEYREVSLSLIDPPRLISRNAVNDAHVDELVESIRALGFISTVILARVGDRYEVVAGDHRTRAATRAGLAAVPALVYPSYDDDMIARQHAENAKQMPTTPCDQAVHFAQLLELHPEDGTDGIARRVGEKRDYVEGRLALLYGDAEVFRALGDGAITIGAAQQLNKCTELAHRRMLLDMAVRGGATVGLVTQWVHEWKTIHAPASGTAAPVAAVATGDAVLQNEYFRCRCCGLTEMPAHMQPIQMHDYCVKAILEPALRQFQRRGDLVDFPRTRDEAEALIERVLERFPELVPT